MAPRLLKNKDGPSTGRHGARPPGEAPPILDAMRVYPKCSRRRIKASCGFFGGPDYAVWRRPSGAMFSNRV
jgi:hypothetical protein